MRARLLLAVAATLALAADKPEDAKAELARLTGRWVGVSMTNEGKKAEPAEAKKVMLVVRGEKYLYRSPALKAPVEGTHQLDPSKKPKHIDAVRGKGPGAGETLKGIYELDGDTFRVCFAAPGKD